MKPWRISSFIMMGDSFSARGILDKRDLLGFIPMSILRGLRRRSPLSQFTNGLVWSDHLSAMIAEEFIIKPSRKKEGVGTSTIVEHVIACERRVDALVHTGYFLNNERVINFKGQNFIRNYDEGGLTAHDYNEVPSTNISSLLSRLTLSTLSWMRKKLLAYDEALELSKQHKAETLLIEWSGANDLTTANARPTRDHADLAIKARIENTKQLIKNGYHHFVLFNLPDLSLTPRYQAKYEECKNAHDCSVYFNEQLAQACQEFTEIYTYCSVEVFDVNSLFTAIYEHPEKHGFDRAKLRQPYIQSTDFIIEKSNITPDKGYMFWDDVHPGASLHAMVAEDFYRKYRHEYNFSTPEIETVEEQ